MLEIPSFTSIRGFVVYTDAVLVRKSPMVLDLEVFVNIQFYTDQFIKLNEPFINSQIRCRRIKVVGKPEIVPEGEKCTRMGQKINKGRTDVHDRDGQGY